MDQIELKKQAGEYAADLVESGMRVGLGTGSTAVWAVRRIGEKLKSGELTDIVAVPTSVRTAEEAESLGIPLASFDVVTELDITIDGADEVDGRLNLIKGGGGALLREKIVAQMTKRLVICVDSSKQVSLLGETWAVPVEVVHFGWESQKRYLESIGATVQVRQDDKGEAYLTDGGNLILDAKFGRIYNILALETKLQRRVGIVESGLFFEMAHDLIVARPEGVKHIQGRIA
ncbi:MAG: ribose 5-phosphate isomerase A [Candidatus Promineifilaceae bacterium]|jgi:ribose 5-phosphate isomerase A